VPQVKTLQHDQEITCDDAARAADRAPSQQTEMGFVFGFLPPAQDD